MFDFPPQLAIDKGQILLLEPSICLLGTLSEITPDEFGAAHGAAPGAAPGARDRSPDSLGATLDGLGLEIVAFADPSRIRHTLVNHTRTRIWVRTRNAAALTGADFTAIREAFRANLEWIGPAYRLPQAAREVVVCPLPDALVVRLKTPAEAGSHAVAAGSAGSAAAAALPDFNSALAHLSGSPAPRLQEIPERSAHLNGSHYFRILNPLEWDAIRVRDLLSREFADVLSAIYFDKMPMICPLSFTPNDTYFGDQWNLTAINAPNAWNFTTGDAGVVVAILDTGCDLGHPDLQFAGQGVNCATMMPPGSEVYFMAPGHGTCTAGIAAAAIDNGMGVSGIAGTCKVLPVATVSFSDTELSYGINYAVNNGATVISMSFGVAASSLVDMALDFALSKSVVLCAAAGNDNMPPVDYPGSYAGVMAVGGTDKNDDRKNPNSPDMECWGATYGDGLSVSAPAVQIWSTDLQGSLGFNNDGAAYMSECITYPSAGDAAGDYFSWFGGTSAATPHVSGFAALLKSQYPMLTGVQIRSIIERTADKTGATPYAVNAAYPNGSWNDQLGYGRINLFSGIDFADVMIKDFPADTGVEPRNPPGGDFWDYSDIVVRPMDDNVFNPSLVAQSKTVVRGQTNYIYVRVTNNGPNTARNVTVGVRITPFVGTQFVATDWTVVDTTHVGPTPILDTFATLPSGAQVMAKYSIDAAQVETLYGWQTADPWHPCLLALVQADNDYAYINDSNAGGTLPIRINNYAQRNLTVVDMGMAGPIIRHIQWPFIAGHLQNAEEFLGLRVDRSRLPGDAVLELLVQETGSAFPLVDFPRTKPRKTNPKSIGLDGHATGRTATVTLAKHPGQLIPLVLRLQLKTLPSSGAPALIAVSQLDQRGELVGGAGFAVFGPSR